jgi:high-affinity Fe2+/Pb2+ permease
VTKSTRHRINAAICVLVLAHAVYWFVTGNTQEATSLRIGIYVAQAVAGLIGAIWFWSRSRGFTT